MDTFSIILRPAQPTYLGAHGLLILPKHLAIAKLIAQLESNREEQLKERIRKLCASLGHSDQIAKAALENLEILLYNHDMILHSDLRVVGTIAFVLALEIQGTFMSYIDASPHFDAPEEPSVSFCLNKARGILTDLVAGDQLEVCLAKLSQGQELQDGNSQRGRASHPSAYFATFQLRITMEEACAAMDLDHEEQFETAPSIDESRSKDGYAEVRIRRFAAGKDWKVRVGTKKDEIKKARETRTKAGQQTKDMGDAMGAL
ncbi:hypothetical protein HBI52_113490 [Parastagonospora nodorum]|nr:hypothetical protein HBI52_113490 [Parastagonospora nodorum]